MRSISTLRLSKNFILRDFLGNTSVYSRGFKNDPSDIFGGMREANGVALCENILEPLLAEAGPFSISYGYISPALSRKIVTYQDPDKPSHHRWDLGAACDVCVHECIDVGDDTYSSSPAALAFAIDTAGLPYSRMITYSESPYICLAASAQEIAAGAPRKAFYENRYTGKAKVKPEFLKYVSPQAKAQGLRALEQHGLPHGWVGAGYPTHHGGGQYQLHHVRISKYSMLTDWLYCENKVLSGVPNAPAMNAGLSRSFSVAGAIYDSIVERLPSGRVSILSGYETPETPHNDWRTGAMCIELWLPDQTAVDTALEVANDGIDGCRAEQVDESIVEVVVCRDTAERQLFD